MMKTLFRARRLIAYGLLLVAAQSLAGCIVVPAYWGGHPYGHYDHDDYRGGWHGDRDGHR